MDFTLQLKEVSGIAKVATSTSTYACIIRHAGPGRFPLALAAQLPDSNVLGIDIRSKVLNTGIRSHCCHICIVC